MRVGGACHHVVVAGAVVALVVADGADDGELVGDGGELFHGLGEVDAGDIRFNRLVVAPDFLGGVGLGIEGLVVAGAAVHPDEDAARLGLGDAVERGAAAEAEGIDQATADEGAQAESEAVSAGDRFAVAVDGHRFGPLTFETDLQGRGVIRFLRLGGGHPRVTAGIREWEENVGQVSQEHASLGRCVRNSREFWLPLF